jgi:hypothetical protein
MTTSEQLAAAREACANETLTPAPWEVNHHSDWPRIEHPLQVEEDCEPDWQHVSDLDDCISDGDSKFIACARSALPLALDRIAELEAALEKIQRIGDSLYWGVMSDARGLVHGTAREALVKP